jgi:hypothetical protein
MENITKGISLDFCTVKSIGTDENNQHPLSRKAAGRLQVVSRGTNLVMYLNEEELEEAAFFYGQRVKVIIRPWTEEEILEEDREEKAITLATLLSRSEYAKARLFERNVLSKMYSEEAIAIIERALTHLQGESVKQQCRDFFAPYLRPDLKPVFDQIDKLLPLMTEDDGLKEKRPKKQLKDFIDYVLCLPEDHREAAIFHGQRYLCLDDIQALKEKLFK